jgi:hypothetical protein
MILSLLINKETVLKINLNKLKNRQILKILKVSKKQKLEQNKLFNSFLDLMMN